MFFFLLNISSKDQTEFLPFIHGHSFWTATYINCILTFFFRKHWADLTQISCSVSIRINFIDMKFVLGHLIKMATMPIYGKTKYV